MYKKWIIFCAEYMVLIEGVLLAVFAYSVSPGLFSSALLFLSATICLLVSVAAAKVLKQIIRKKRPAAKTEYFRPFDTYAFPSGHATGLFSVTYFIASIDIMFGAVSLLVTLFILSGRVKSHVHDTVDMLGGAFLGVVLTYILMPSVTESFVPYLIYALL
jgi:undecaprenyl-diphosphatase